MQGGVERWDICLQQGKSTMNPLPIPYPSSKATGDVSFLKIPGEEEYSEKT